MKQEARVSRRPEDGKNEPALPHERDQKASDEKRDVPDDKARTQKGFEDAESGQPDTGIQPVIERTDRKLRGSTDH